MSPTYGPGYATWETISELADGRGPVKLWLAQFAASMPGFFDILWRAGLWVLSAWAIFLIVAPAWRTSRDRRHHAVTDQAGPSVSLEPRG